MSLNDSDRYLLSDGSDYKRTRVSSTHPMRPEQPTYSTRYDLQDWFIDACDRGICLNCKGFALERLSSSEAQCYSCGKWFCGYDIGSSYDSFIELSTAYQKKQAQHHQSQTYVSQKFEEKMSSAPKPPEPPESTESHENFGGHPGEGV